MDLFSRRSSPRSAPTVGLAVRLRERSPGTIATSAVAAALGLAVVGLGASLRPAVQSTRAGVGEAGGRAAAPSIPTVAALASLPDVPWLSQLGDGTWVYGRGERRPVRRLPAGETGVAIGRDFVASVVAGAGGRSTIRFRDRESGRVRGDVAAPIWVSAGAWTTAGLVVTGYGDASAASDGGVVLVSPETGATSVLVPGAAFPARLGRPVARGDVLVSPSGATAATNLCGVELCELQVVTLATGVVSRPVQDAPGFLRAVTDDAVVTTDDAGSWISARLIIDGAERWRLRNTALIDPVAVADGSIVGLTGSTRGGWAIAAIDAAGRTRDLTPRRRARDIVPQLWPMFSSGETVVVASASFGEVLDRGRPVAVSVVTVHDGHIAKAAVHLPAATETVP